MKFAPAPSRQRRRSSSGGFTLIELLVVVAMLGILVTAIALTMGGSSRQALMREGERLRLLLELADAETLRSGAGMQWFATEDGYYFVRPAGASGHDERFGPRRLPQGIRVGRVTLDGRALPVGSRIVFRRGVTPLYSIELGNATEWLRLESQPDGGVRVGDPAAGT